MEEKSSKRSRRPNRGPWFAAVPPTGAPAFGCGAGEGSLPPWGFDIEGGARKRGVQGGETVAGEGGALSDSPSRRRAWLASLVETVFSLAAGLFFVLCFGLKGG